MWNPFRRKPLLSDDDRDFQIACYAWLLRHFGGEDFDEARLVLPTAEFFPKAEGSAHNRALACFDQVRALAGMQEWKAELVAQEEDPEQVVGDLLIVQGVQASPLGTFSADERDVVTITYNPRLVRDPAMMVATFAHELAHYLTATAPEEPPGGWDNWEFATDVTASFLGFGIFMANTSFRFQQYSGAGIAGWRSSGGGYLSQPEHSYALALFLRLKGIDVEQALPYCDPNVRGFLKHALADIDNCDIIDKLGEFMANES